MSTQEDFKEFVDFKDYNIPQEIEPTTYNDIWFRCIKMETKDGYRMYKEITPVNFKCYAKLTQVTTQVSPQVSTQVSPKKKQKRI